MSLLDFAVDSVTRLVTLWAVLMVVVTAAVVYTRHVKPRNQIRARRQKYKRRPRR